MHQSKQNNMSLYSPLKFHQFPRLPFSHIQPLYNKLCIRLSVSTHIFNIPTCALRSAGMRFFSSPKLSPKGAHHYWLKADFAPLLLSLKRFAAAFALFGWLLGKCLSRKFLSCALVAQPSGWKICSQEAKWVVFLGVWRALPLGVACTWEHLRFSISRHSSKLISDDACTAASNLWCEIILMLSAAGVQRRRN